MRLLHFDRADAGQAEARAKLQGLVRSAAWQLRREDRVTCLDRQNLSRGPLQPVDKFTLDLHQLTVKVAFHGLQGGNAHGRGRRAGLQSFHPGSAQCRAEAGDSRKAHHIHQIAHGQSLGVVILDHDAAGRIAKPGTPRPIRVGYRSPKPYAVSPIARARKLQQIRNGGYGHGEGIRGRRPQHANAFRSGHEHLDAKHLMFPIEQRATYAAQLHVGVQQVRQRLGRGRHVGLICVAAPGERQQGVRPSLRDALDDALQFDEVAVLAAPTDLSKARGCGRRQAWVAENSNAGFGHVGSKIRCGHSDDIHLVARPHRRGLFFAQFDKNAIA